MTKPKVLVICDISEIEGVGAILESFAEVTYRRDPTQADVVATIGGFDAIFCQPNNTNVFVGRDMIDAGRKLRAICTASTGTHHIDVDYAAAKKLPVLTVYHDPIIYKVSSTAELNFGLMLAAVRRIPQGFAAVKRGEWDHRPYRGQQLDQLTVGIVGFERLGNWFASYCRPFGCKLIAFDHTRKVTAPDVTQLDRDAFCAQADVISFQVYWPAAQTIRVDAAWFARMKPNVILVNSARGDIVDEAALLAFLDRNPGAMYATDVLENEIAAKATNPVVAYARSHDNVIITPHLGGQTKYGQEAVYQRSAEMLKEFFAK